VTPTQNIMPLPNIWLWMKFQYFLREGGFQKYTKCFSVKCQGIVFCLQEIKYFYSDHPTRKTICFHQLNKLP